MTPENKPADIANELIRQHGQAVALQEAMRLSYEAQSDGRLYDLSVWREVKKLLREMA